MQNSLIKNKFNQDKLNKHRTNIRLNHNGLLPKMLSIKNGDMLSNINDNQLLKIKDFLGLNELARHEELIQQINKYYF